MSFAFLKHRMLFNIRVWQQITGWFSGSRKKTEELSTQNEQNFISDEEKLVCKKRRKEKRKECSPCSLVSTQQSLLRLKSKYNEDLSLQNEMSRK